MTNWTSSYVESNGVQVYVTRTGGDNPPVVLAHGVTDDGLCWTPLAKSLEADYDVIMVDARGHGRSSAPESGYDPAVMAVDLAGVCTALKLERPAILGHSMGAITAIALAGAYPELPGSILAEDPPPWWMGAMPPPDDGGEDVPTRMRARITKLKKLNKEQLIAHQRSETPWWTDEELDCWSDAKVRFNVAGLALFDKSVVTSVNWSEALPRIACPMLLITADPERGAIVSNESAGRFKEMVPRTQIAHIEEAGHSIHRDQPAVFLSTVRAFLKEHSSG